MTARIDSREQWTAFLDRLVHDVREPLRSIHAFSELLGEIANGRLGAEGDHVVGEIVTGAARIRTILDGVSAYSVSLRGCDSSINPASLQTSFKIAAARLDDQIRASGATVKGVDVSAGTLPKLDIGLESLSQVLENLLSNSLRFRSEAAPVINVSAAPYTDNMWAVCVSDNGIGISPDNRETIFLPFMSVHGKKYPGAGLGLPICKAIVESRGGTIQMESSPEGGSIFRFTIPEA